MLPEKQNLGFLGEKAAARYLEEKGYKVLDRNFKNDIGRRLGEIDIIAKDIKENEIVFVEVKTRNFDKYGNTNPEENITYAKLKKLSKIANTYLRLNNLDDEAYRFDAISVWINQKNEEAKIKHIASL